jgi:hypothetical protein
MLKAYIDDSAIFAGGLGGTRRKVGAKHRRWSRVRPAYTNKPTDNGSVGEHVVIVIAPLAGRARGGRAFEDQLAHRKRP